MGVNRATAGGTTGRYEHLQAGLAPLLEANRPGSGVEHVLVVLPSYSVGESLLSHFANRIPALEHRFLLATLLLGRIESCELVFVSCQAPEPEVLDYYESLLPPERRDSARARLRILTVPDASARSVAAKLLDRPDLLEDLRASIGGRPALIEPWNVTESEVEVACHIGAAINGTRPDLRPLGFKSHGRRLFARAGVPMPVGREDVRTVDDVLDAIDAIRAARPGVAGVVVKHDDSGTGDGNVVVDLVAPGSDRQGLRARLNGLPAWYVQDLRLGGVTEELITGEWFSSPSAQIDVQPSGRVVVLATHEQVLGGDSNQVYIGCRFPADDAYAAEIARHARAVGKELAREGAVGRASVDFAAARDRAGRWTVAALEINLRKGGTTHPYSALRNLVPGRYDADAARWVSADGTTRAYVASDNVVDAAWRGLPPAAVLEAVAGAGLRFDRASGTGVVLHMLSCLAIDGRFGMTAIGGSPEQAEELYEAAVAAVAAAAAARTGRL